MGEADHGAKEWTRDLFWSESQQESLMRWVGEERMEEFIGDFYIYGSYK